MHMSRRFDGLIFDMGDILYDASVWRRWLCGLLNEYGIAIDYPELVERWEELLVDVYRGQAPYWERFDRLMVTVGLPEAYHDRVRDLARQKAEEVQTVRSPIDGVPETLESLRSAGVRMAVLSDTESGVAKVSAMLMQLGIREAFDAVVTSAEIGFVKPDPRAFAAALEALELDASRVAFVGHDVDELTGSMDVGLFSVAFNYDPAAPYDVSIERFEELERVVLN